MINNEDLHESFKQAVSKGNQEKVKTLVASQGFSQIADGGYSFICTALSNNRDAITKLLLESGAQVNIETDQVGDTPLHLAVQWKKVEIIEMLLNRGADVNAQDGKKKTPIYYAAKLGSVKIFRILVARGAVVSDYSDVVHAAITAQSLETVKEALNCGTVDVNACVKEGVTALVASLQRHCEDITAVLLEKGADVHVGCVDGISPLHLASANGDHKNCETMLKKGAAVGATNDKGRTPLHRASTAETVKVLVKFGADIHARDLKGRTPFLTATYYKFYYVVETLLNFGADIDTVDKKGQTALHYATKNLSHPLVRLLLGYGADINILDEKNITPFCINIFQHRLGFINRMDGSPNQALQCLMWYLSHIVRIRTINWHVSQDNLRSVREAQKICHKLDKKFITNERRLCEEEIGMLRVRKISNSNISYYDFLTRNLRSLPVFLRNENIVHAFQSKDISEEEFPHYAPLLKAQFRKAMERKGLVEQCFTWFDCLCGDLPRLPAFCVEEIFKYLSKEDLQMLVEDFNTRGQSPIEGTLTILCGGEASSDGAVRGDGSLNFL